MTALRQAIAALLEDPLDVVLARSILGTDDVETIAARVEAVVAGALGRRAASCPLVTQSVGAVFVLDLDDGARVVVKAHPIGDGGRNHGTLAELEAVYRVQAHLADRGFPCAAVLAPPRPWPGGAVAIMTFLDAPAGDDPHRPVVRRAMARGLFRSVELCRGLALPDLRHERLPDDSVLPHPHNALFHLDAPGGEWIDARARTARDLLDRLPAPPLVMHTDISAANARVRGDTITAVFDMDSVAWTDEMLCLARTAVHFSYHGEAGSTWPSRDEAIAFVADYLEARGRPLDGDERLRLDAAAIYALAYTARCQHGFGLDHAPMAALLRAAPDAYFG
jgi:hypothetical protein